MLRQLRQRRPLAPSERRDGGAELLGHLLERRLARLRAAQRGGHHGVDHRLRLHARNAVRRLELLDGRPRHAGERRHGSADLLWHLDERRAARLGVLERGLLHPIDVALRLLDREAVVRQHRPRRPLAPGERRHGAANFVGHDEEGGVALGLADQRRRLHAVDERSRIGE